MGYGRGIARAGQVIAVALLLAGCSAQETPPTPPRPVMVVQPQNLHTGIQVFSGEVRAREEPALAFRVAGEIIRRHADTGARVHAGDVLAELDAKDLLLQITSARAQLAAAESDLELARAEQERYAEMRERKLVSQSIFDARQATFAAAQAQVRQARAQFEVMENQRNYARLTAPSDGVIVSRHAEAGQVVAAGQTVFVLAADGDRDVAISVPELQMQHFDVGQQVLVELWSQPGERWPATVRELSRAADPQARTFAARVAFQGPEDLLELGQSARVYVIEQDINVLAIPLTAVDGEAGAAYVYVIDPATSRAKRRQVQVSSWGEQVATITEGLSAEDWVVSGGIHLIGEGDLLRPVDRDNRSIDLQASP